MRDGIQLRALLEVAETGRDDTGQAVRVNKAQVNHARGLFEQLWADNPVQWHLSYDTYRRAVNLLHEAVATTREPTPRQRTE